MTSAASVARVSRRAPSQPRSPWRIAAARVRRDRVALAALGFLLLLVFTVSAGAPLAAHLLGHGPNDPFPYAVDIIGLSAVPLTHLALPFAVSVWAAVVAGGLRLIVGSPSEGPPVPVVTASVSELRQDPERQRRNTRLAALFFVTGTQLRGGGLPPLARRCREP
jgi:hypothetical protein